MIDKNSPNSNSEYEWHFAGQVNIYYSRWRRLKFDRIIASNLLLKYRQRFAIWIKKTGERLLKLAPTKELIPWGTKTWREAQSWRRDFRGDGIFSPIQRRFFVSLCNSTWWYHITVPSLSTIEAMMHRPSRSWILFICTPKSVHNNTYISYKMLRHRSKIVWKSFKISLSSTRTGQIDSAMRSF